jgi:hypothetical protein
VWTEFCLVGSVCSHGKLKRAQKLAMLSSVGRRKTVSCFVVVLVCDDDMTSDVVGGEHRALDVYDDAANDPNALVSMEQSRATIPTWQAMLDASLVRPAGDVELRTRAAAALQSLATADGMSRVL